MDEEEVTGFAVLGEGKQRAGRFIMDHLYSIIIALCSLLVVVFVPMIGSSIKGESIIPKDPQEQFIFWVIKGLTVALNLFIFASFRQQARKNAKDNKNYKKALEMLEKRTKREKRPLSPVEYGLRQWGTKGVTLTLTTALTTMALTNLILYYDWATCVSCVVTIAIAVIFGLFTMGSEQYYWEVDFLKYAESVKGEENGTSGQQMAEHPAAGSKEQE